jgi:hypothetical protein
MGYSRVMQRLHHFHLWLPMVARMRQTSNSFPTVRVLEGCRLLEYHIVPVLQMRTRRPLQALFLSRHLVEQRRRLAPLLMQLHPSTTAQEGPHRQPILLHHPLSTSHLLDILQLALVTHPRRLRSLRRRLGIVRSRHRSVRPLLDTLRPVHHSARHLHDIHQPHLLTCRRHHLNTPRRHQWLRRPLLNIRLLLLLIHQHPLPIRPPLLAIALPRPSGRLRAQPTTRMGRRVPTIIRQSHHTIEG